jgi:hypothetical protein
MSLPVRELRAREFRSLKAITYPVSSLDVFVGGNGVGKTNLYRALELLQSAAANTLARGLAQDGGLESALWAGPRRRTQPARIHLSVGLAADTQKAGSRALYRLRSRSAIRRRRRPRPSWPSLRSRRRRSPMWVEAGRRGCWTGADPRSWRGRRTAAPPRSTSTCWTPRRCSVAWKSPRATPSWTRCAGRSCNGGSTTACGPTLPRPCASRARPLRPRRWLPMVRTWRRCSPPWRISARTLL